MQPNAFIGKKKAPTARELSLALGRSHQLWQDLISLLQLTPEWNSYSAKAGWSLKLKQRQRTILYLIPYQGWFGVAFILGDKAIGAASATAVPKHILHLIAEGKKYPEGTAVRFEHVEAADLATIATLARIKLAN